MAEALFWGTLKSLESAHPRFRLEGRKYCAFPRRFKKVISVVDSSTIKLVANCIDWAKHRRRKAAAKMHLRLDLASFLPAFILVKSAGSNDAKEARAVCYDIKDGEIVTFDKAYVDFKHLYELLKRGVFWVTRTKDNMKYEVVGQHMAAEGNIIRDVVIRLTGVNTSKWYPETLRLVEAFVEVDKKMKRMTFITDNFEWASSSVVIFTRPAGRSRCSSKKSSRHCSYPILWDIMKCSQVAIVDSLAYLCAATFYCLAK